MDPATVKGGLLRRDRLPKALLLAGLVVALAAVAFLVPMWWSPVPLLSLVGWVGARRFYPLAPLAGFVVGFGLWGALLLTLPSLPQERLTEVLARAEGTSPTLFFLLGPLLFGLVVALGAAAVAGMIRLRAPPPPRKDLPTEPGADSAEEPGQK
jgi:hypothetical protein